LADQAETLRKLVKKKFSEKIIPFKSKKASTSQKTIAVTSGKGGVGKTNIVANISILLSSLKVKVLILDADLGLANIHILLDLKPKYDLYDVITGKKSLAEVMMEGPKGITIIPGASGIEELANLTTEQRDFLLSRLSVLEDQFDIVFIDTGAGLSNNVLRFVFSADEVLVITTPEPTAITDAYGMIKVVQKKNKSAKLKLIVNMAKDLESAKSAEEKILSVAGKHLKNPIETLGYILADKNVQKSVSKQKAFVLEHPNASASVALKKIVKKIYTTQKQSDNSSGFTGFLKKLSLSFRLGWLD
jgi:flagellar biosynthesis protein FlhG